MIGSTLYTLSNFDIRHDVMSLHISGELPQKVHVVYGIAAKHAKHANFMVTRSEVEVHDITFDLKIGHRVYIYVRAL